MSRDKTPSLLDELASAAKAPKPKPAKSTAEEKPRDRVEGKRKVTYYLSDEALDRLEDAWIRERRQAKRDDRDPLSKSQMVEQALAEYLAKRP